MSLIVMRPGKTERGYWHDLWRYRELFFFLSWRDILVRYKQDSDRGVVGGHQTPADDDGPYLCL